MAKVNVRDRNKNKPDRKPNWEYRFEIAPVGGKRQSFSKSGYSTKKDALAHGAKALAEYNSAGTTFEPSQISVSDYLDFWYEQHCKINLKYNTLQAYLGIIENHLKPYFGHYKVSSLSPFIIQEFANDVVLKGLSKSHSLGIISTFQAALDYAIFPLGYIKENPARLIKFPAINKKKRERIILSKDDFNTLIRQFPFGNRFHLPLLLGWYCGLRISETCALTWEDIDFENKTLSVQRQTVKRSFGVDPRRALELKGKKEIKCGWYFTDPKYGSFRTICIGDALTSALLKEKQLQEEREKEYGDLYTIHVAKKEKDEKGEEIVRIVPVQKCVQPTLPRINLVTVSENGEFTSSDSFKYVGRVARNKLLLPFSYHSLRHTHATVLIGNGVEAKAVQQRLGHRSIITTLQVYVHTTEKMKDKAVNVFEKYARLKPD